VNRRSYYWLLIVPFVATLVPPFYVHRDPELFGFPFFYWYQIAWIVISAAIVLLAYVMTRDAERD
jgi:Protein of unknown function (DUF3311)